jgi:hypothetical protein
MGADPCVEAEMAKSTSKDPTYRERTCTGGSFRDFSLSGLRLSFFLI